MLPKLILATLGLAGLTLGSTLKVWTATLDAKGGSGINGTARAESVPHDSTSATVNVKGAAPNSSLTWGLHSGKCAALGAMLGAGYAALQTDSTGAGSASTTVALEMHGDKDYSAVIHGSAAGSVAACGTFKPAM